jgi:hypothetical protein
MSVLGATAVAVACSGAEGEHGGHSRPVERFVAAGTAVQLRARGEITSRENKVGDPVAAVAAAPVRDANGDTVIPAGAEFTGSVTEIKAAPNPRASGQLAIVLSQVRFGGASHAVHMRVTTMGTTMQGRGITAGTAAKVGAGAVVGGVAGRVIGGNATGTVVGAVAGAAAGGVVAHETRTLDIVLPDGAPIRAVFTSRFSPGAAPRATTD